ncbi:MAG: phage tail sheath family protein [Gammaproteobacteria bacterium]|nr:phage tail sheath family protein [Gammaproteobacteria bacterium]
MNARSEGSWGNRLQVSLGYNVTPVDLINASTTELTVGVDEGLSMGSLLRLSVPTPGDDPDEFVLRFISSIRRRGNSTTGDESLLLSLDAPLPAIPEFAELVEGDLLVDDGAGVRERFKGLGLCAQHPRWLATVLYNDSALLYPHHDWVSGEIKPLYPQQLPVAPQIVPDIDLLEGAMFSGGFDRYTEIVHEDFFDSRWTTGDDRPGSGVHALTWLADLSSVVVVDLYVPEPISQRDNVLDQRSLAGAHFESCVAPDFNAGVMDDTEHPLSGLLLDPADPADLEQITQLQQRLVALADSLSNFVVLLDVPPGLSQQKIVRWRSRFRSSYTAAYYPWLKISSLNDSRDALVLLNPAATAAGIIAKQELAFGVPHGPANVIAEGVVTVGERVSATRHNELHPLGINIYLQQRGGVWLSAGRTLSRNKHYRQLSVRRFMLMLRRALNQQMHWMVFEPNGPALWSDVRHMLNNYLRRFYMAGAFKGSSEEEAFFVRCDSELNTRRIVDAGRMVCEIGVAVAEPLEFIVVRITRGGDGTLAIES